MMFFENISTYFYSFLFWWVILFAFQRLSNKYPKKSSLKRDLLVSVLQTFIALLFFPVILHFLGR